MQTLDRPGMQMPLLGFGTFQLQGSTACHMVEAALEIGYTHIDTAQNYGNEAEVGAAVAAAGVPRERLFITTKVWIDRFRDWELQLSVDESLKRLHMDYVDLLLLHWPNPRVPLAETVAALNAVHRQGLARAIGVSNFTIALMQEAAALSEAPLAMNQVEYHPYLDQSRVIAAAERLGLGITAYAPLARGRIIGDPVLREIGAHYGKNAAQVALRWLVQQGVAAIPRSARIEHARTDFAIFDFKLSAGEMARIHALARPGGRLVAPTHLAPEWD
ncbi:MAG TPA: aldo/keto reductase [Candidatus Competibacteraceae bacterium]|nr:aldo/keto reductase [Candidatus Competibacteraceae bacterium]